MNHFRGWARAADVVMAVSGPVWLLGTGADEPSGEIAAQVAAWGFMAVGAPRATAWIARLHRRWRDDGRPFARALRTPVLAVCLTFAVALAGRTIGGTMGGTTGSFFCLRLVDLGAHAE